MTEDYTLQLKLLHGFSNKIRYRILMVLKDGERNVSDLVTLVGGSQSAVSQHLACLKDCGLIEKRLEGKFYFYRLTSPQIPLLLDLLNESSHDFHWDEQSEVVKCEHHMA
ncbi:ArsR/SmtB family transcription factor [Agrilactobacillus yilanensis]|uniref:ArsR/SmtB family transcription factor n=1 Tax=Agrilactobacillus yilanensis TaxID=2485997 RepID=A0ABW4J5E7_9LACO|nr:metalloregulator ArsR/SmtB family transcription factor [Agrilactobacillus yilanensis]